MLWINSLICKSICCNLIIIIFMIHMCSLFFSRLMEKFKRQSRLRIGEAKTMRIGYLSTRCHTSLSRDLVSLIPMGKVGGLLLSWTPDHRYFKTIQQVEFKMSIYDSKTLIVLSEGFCLCLCRHCNLIDVTTLYIMD